MTTRTSSSPTNIRRQRGGGLLGAVIVGASVLIGSLLIAKTKTPALEIPKAAPVVSEFDTVAVPVPLEPIAAGTKVKDIKFQIVRFPKHQVPLGALERLDSWAEATVIAPLPANLPLFEANFSRTSLSSNPVLDRIPQGMRAMTIKVDATSAVEGWAGSGSVVDVLMIGKDKTTVIAERVKILSAERSVVPIEGQSSPTVPTTVTLLVTQEQCLAINTAIPLGRIAFALRSTRDEEAWNDTHYTADQLSGSPAYQAQKGDKVIGVVSIKDKDGQNSSAFALTGGKWVKTEVVPEGFFNVGKAEVKKEEGK